MLTEPPVQALPKTKAVIITPENYDIVAACLPAGFLKISRYKLFKHRHVLVIHEVDIQSSKSKHTRADFKHITLSNVWYEYDEFITRYDTPADVRDWFDCWPRKTE